MAITCSQCGHWSLNGEHECPAVQAKYIKQAIVDGIKEGFAASRQIVIQLPDKPGMEYDDLLIALMMFLQKSSREDEWTDPEATRD